MFAFLFPAWGIDFTLKPNWDGGDGAWAVTNPPQEYNWGGSYVHACTGTDNPQHVKDIILAVTADKDNLLKISKEKTDFTNTQSSMRKRQQMMQASHQSSLAARMRLNILPLLQKILKWLLFLLMTRDALN